jgi:hypothetical protein
VETILDKGVHIEKDRHPAVVKGRPHINFNGLSEEKTESSPTIDPRDISPSPAYKPMH